MTLEGPEVQGSSHPRSRSKAWLGNPQVEHDGFKGKAQETDDSVMIGDVDRMGVFGSFQEVS